jgi:hypothetical protein
MHNRRRWRRGQATQSSRLTEAPVRVGQASGPGVCRPVRRRSRLWRRCLQKRPFRPFTRHRRQPPTALPTPWWSPKRSKSSTLTRQPPAVRPAHRQRRRRLPQRSQALRRPPRCWLAHPQFLFRFRRARHTPHIRRGTGLRFAGALAIGLGHGRCLIGSTDRSARWQFDAVLGMSFVAKQAMLGANPGLFVLSSGNNGVWQYTSAIP